MRRLELDAEDGFYHWVQGEGGAVDGRAVKWPIFSHYFSVKPRGQYPLCRHRHYSIIEEAHSPAGEKGLGVGKGLNGVARDPDAREIFFGRGNGFG